MLIHILPMVSGPWASLHHTTSKNHGCLEEPHLRILFRKKNVFRTRMTKANAKHSPIAFHLFFSWKSWLKIQNAAFLFSEQCVKHALEFSNRYYHKTSPEWGNGFEMGEITIFQGNEGYFLLNLKDRGLFWLWTNLKWTQCNKKYGLKNVQSLTNFK